MKKSLARIYIALVILFLLSAIFFVFYKRGTTGFLFSTLSSSPPSLWDIECARVYGSIFQRCPPKTLGRYNCCKLEHVCCGLLNSAAPICCDPKISECGKLEGKNICNYKGCYKNSERPNWCGAGDFGICCKSDEVCGSIKVGLDIGIVIGKTVPICVKEGCDSDEQDITEGNLKVKIDGETVYAKVCCERYEGGWESNGYYWCIAGRCPEGQTLCKGVREFEGDYNICCKSGTNCFNNPNGFPVCVPKPLASPSPSPSPKVSPSPSASPTRI